jgi:hypothetical protein
VTVKNAIVAIAAAAHRNAMGFKPDIATSWVAPRRPDIVLRMPRQAGVFPAQSWQFRGMVNGLVHTGCRLRSAPHKAIIPLYGQALGPNPAGGKPRFRQENVMLYRFAVLGLAVAALAAVSALPASAFDQRPPRQTAQESPPKAVEPAQPRPDPRDRVAACHKQAHDRKLEGDARKTFMATCSGRKTQATSARQKAKGCAEQA